MYRSNIDADIHTINVNTHTHTHTDKNNQYIQQKYIKNYLDNNKNIQKKSLLYKSKEFTSY
jgi:di/tripeptidase